MWNKNDWMVFGVQYGADLTICAAWCSILKKLHKKNIINAKEYILYYAAMCLIHASLLRVATVKTISKWLDSIGIHSSISDEIV